MKTTHLQITGMTCTNCVRHVTEALMAVLGVHSAAVDLTHGSARVEHEDVDPAFLVAALEEEGYGSAVLT